MRNFTSTPQKQPAAKVASSVMGFPSCRTSFILTRILVPLRCFGPEKVSGPGLPSPSESYACGGTYIGAHAVLRGGSQRRFDFEFGDHGKVVGGDQGPAAAMDVEAF